MSEPGQGIDEGYVKYDSHWSRGPAPDAGVVAALNAWRKPLFDAGLIGHSAEHNVGYGNISVRAQGTDGFVISGTQTGHIENTAAEHYALVTAVDLDANAVVCHGPIQASSEALTHAALYALSEDVRAVVHVHDAALWAQSLDLLPTTDRAIAYGTPAMALEFERLWRETDFAERRIAVMAGHDDGLVSIGTSLQQAATLMLDRAARSAST